jgi:uncharacterized protein YraI
VTPDFFTAILPFTQTPQATRPPDLPVSTPGVIEEFNTTPIEGMTTTQVNLREAPSTASTSLGMIGIFAKVQVIGRDPSGSWYQILYAESEAGKGWVRAEYVQVNPEVVIPLVETTSGSGAAVNGLVTQKVNVRNGPGTTYELLGVLNPDDVVFIIGRDPDSQWIQVEFAGAPDGKGWVTAEFLQAGSLDNVPLIGGAIEETPTLIVGIPTTISATRDGDTMQSPLAVAAFLATGPRALQVNGDVSAPDGDAEDWIQFTSRGSVVSIQLTCPKNALLVELWNNGESTGEFHCGETSLPRVTPDSDYFLRLIQIGNGHTSYILNLEVIP